MVSKPRCCFGQTIPHYTSTLEEALVTGEHTRSNQKCIYTSSVTQKGIQKLQEALEEKNVDKIMTVGWAQLSEQECTANP